MRRVGETGPLPRKTGNGSGPVPGVRSDLWALATGRVSGCLASSYFDLIAACCAGSSADQGGGMGFHSTAQLRTTRANVSGLS